MTAVHVLASVAAHCVVCGGVGSVVLERHFIAECDLKTPVQVVCPHCGIPNFPVHHYHHQSRSA